MITSLTISSFSDGLLVATSNARATKVCSLIFGIHLLSVRRLFLDRYQTNRNALDLLLPSTKG
ncbi:MAG: hypothetical protein Q8O99_07285 [bacterium]|nr:hypothetical protein [bacterium]